MILAAGGVLAYGPTEEELISRSATWRSAARDDLPTALALFALADAGLIALSLPVGFWMTVLAGFLFGTWVGTAVVSVSSTIGAAAAFGLARYAVAGPVRRAAATRPRLAQALAGIDRAVAAHGAYSIALLRMTPVVPFWLVNLGLALTPVRFREYVFVSWLAMLPVTLVVAHAGAELAAITRFRDVLSARVLGALAMMPLVPVLLHHTAGRWLGRAPSRSG